jgi:hypothetical protein
MVLRHILAALCGMFSEIPITTDGGGPTAWPSASSDLNPLDLYLWGHLKVLVYAAPVDNDEALHHCIVAACQTIHIYRGISERMRRSMMRRAEACIASHGGYYEHLLY